MRERGNRWLGLGLAAALATAVSTTAVQAAPLTVGEFRWDTQNESGGMCTPDDSACLSIFSLTNLLSDPGPALSGVLRLDGAEAATLGPVPTGALNFEQFGPVVPEPVVASLLVTFNYQDVDRALLASLSAPGSQTLFLESEQTPEPGVALLLAVGLGGALIGRRRRSG